MIKRYYIDDLMWSSPSLDGGKTFPHQLISIPSNETKFPHQKPSKRKLLGPDASTHVMYAEDRPIS